MVANKVTIWSDCTLVDYFEVACFRGSRGELAKGVAQDCGTLQISQSDNKDLGDPITIKTYYRQSKHPASERIRDHLPSPKIVQSAAGISASRSIPVSTSNSAQAQEAQPQPYSTYSWSSSPQLKCLFWWLHSTIANRIILPCGNFQSMADLFIQGFVETWDDGIIFSLLGHLFVS